tara:strand:+ start:2537 stop:2722 length:186 start_codon:yes stop_codon:yes gene_type:complete
MAKFTRFDPRNKKNGRNKRISIFKDFKIHEVEKSRKLIGHTFDYVVIDENEQNEIIENTDS